jgi:hypothetical protein
MTQRRRGDFLAHVGQASGFACAGKDDEVVEYALSRSLSPALIAEYQLQLPDKKLLQIKLREYYELAQMAGTVGRAKMK